MQDQNGGGGTSKVLWAGAAIGAGYLLTRAMRARRADDLDGQVALITGGTSGLGLLMAREFARSGCKIVICARGEDELRVARDELAREGYDVLALPCDVADQQQVEDLVRRATEHFGSVDILVNNAGIIQVGPIDTIELSDFKQAMDIMFWGAVYPTMSVLPQMKERGSGRIVNITSIGGKVSVPHLVPYSSAKFAHVGFSEGLRAELKEDGITVTTIVPGLMRTGSFLNAEFKGQQKKEFIWFSLGSSLPFVSMDAERAARQIVEATRNGDAERVLSAPATLLAKFHGVFPGATSEILSLVERMVLPEPDGRESDMAQGRDVQDELDSSMQRAATTLGQESAERFQHDPESAPEIWDDPRD